ncbi:MAG: hypothetical protein GC156_11305 [Actinomycetales bacterium]|nr:hypothetical protein [Actinomycetales bacterium]
MTLNPADMDTSVDPGADFYRFANGGWLDATTIPPGYGAWGAAHEVHERNETVILELLERAAAEPASDLERMLGDYFAAGMDVDGIEHHGLAPIQDLLDRIAALSSHDEVLTVVTDLHREGFHPLWSLYCDVDFEDSSQHLLWLALGGLGLPERDSYVNDSEATTALRSAYVDHIDRQLANVQWPGADAGRRVLALETRLAEHHLRSEQRRDPDLTLNRRNAVQLGELAPGLALPSYLNAIGVRPEATVNVEHPDYLAAVDAIVAETDLDTLKAYLAFQVVSALADSLPQAIDDENFAFYGRRVFGKKEQKPRHKRVMDAVGHDLGEALGHRFVELTFPPEAKERALSMIDDILEEMRASLQSRRWMGEQTRDRGLAKLATFRVKVGYPDSWRDWSGLQVTRDSYGANRRAAMRFESEYQLRRSQGAVDRNEWEMPPHVVNAYYHPNLNEIVFPAGILQPPFFDADADDALNYGGIGAVIAHEITHGFDDQGRRFDENGAFSDWWTPEDQERFTALADRLAEQFDAYVAVDDVHVNGRLTLGENIADLGGVTLAYRALMRTAPTDELIDGLTPEQRFFVSWATVWRQHVSDELARTLAQIDPHSPDRLRATAPLSNLDAFAAAFTLDEESPAMRPAAERIEIW